MIDMKRFVPFFFAFAVIIAASVSFNESSARRPDSRKLYFGRSVAPVEDSIVIERMKVRLDSIRQYRPTVALVMVRRALPTSVCCIISTLSRYLSMSCSGLASAA